MACTDGGGKGHRGSAETMRDRLGTSKWLNLPSRNPTQAYMRRFVRNPSLPLETGFTRMKKAWDENMASKLKTKYDEFFE